jgi:hypothetical protein
MRKRSNDRIYDTLALVVLVIGWCWMWWAPPNSYQTQLGAMNQAMENGLLLTKAEIQDSDSSFRAKVYEWGSEPTYLANMKRIAMLRQKTNEVIYQLAQLKQALLQGKDVYQLMIRNNKLADFHQLTHTHVQWRGQEFRDLDLPKIAFQGSNHHITNSDHFGRATTVAAIGLLSQKQLEIRYFEKLVAQKLMHHSMYYCGFDQVEPYVVIPLHQIQVGDTYMADIFAGKSAQNIFPRMTSQGQTIAIKDGVGKVEIPTSKSGKFYWSGSITYRDIYQQKERTVQLKQAYEVLPK